MSDVATPDVTDLLLSWAEGDGEAFDELWSTLYGELRSLARRYLFDERSGHSLQSTDLVHETYLRLVDQQRVDARHREQFFGLAARTMRNVLVDHARRRLAVKRGSGGSRVSLHEMPHLSDASLEELVTVDEALGDLAALDPELARLVELRFFGGFKNAEIAEIMQWSVPTITRRWRVARAWLYRHLSEEAS